MASSRNETNLTWSSTAVLTLAANNTRYVSDELAFNAEDWEADIYLLADCAATAATGDYVECFIHYTAGDADGDASNDYPTNDYAEYLGRLNVYATDTPGEDPAARVLPLRTAAKAIKVSVEGPQVASRNINVRARVITHRVQ
jgi:hypothetical protein